MRKLLTTTVLTAGLLASSLAGAGAASASTGPQLLEVSSPGTAIDTADAVETAKQLILDGCTTQFVNRALGISSGTLVSVSGLDVTVHGSRALVYAVAHTNNAVSLFLCVV